MSKWLKLTISILVPLAVAWVASIFTRPEIDGWYQEIKRPEWNPPSWLFAPVWITLYIMMGIALYLVWKSTANIHFKKAAIGLFWLQLLFNFFWSIIFFNQHQIGWALVDIILLWVSIFLTIITFSKINKTAAWLLVPYISWVSFALLLNAAIFKLNAS